MRRLYRKILEKTLAAFIFILFVTVGYLGYAHYAIRSQVETPVLHEEVAAREATVAQDNVLVDPLSLDDYLQVDVTINPGKMILAKNCTGIAMTTTVDKTYSIERGVESKLTERPNEHDLIYDVINNYGIKVLSVRMSRATKDVFYATILLERDNQVLGLDAKPSDALALAARFNAPVYIRSDIFEKHKQNVCEKEK